MNGIKLYVGLIVDANLSLSIIFSLIESSVFGSSGTVPVPVVLCCSMLFNFCNLKYYHPQ